MNFQANKLIFFKESYKFYLGYFDWRIFCLLAQLTFEKFAVLIDCVDSSVVFRIYLLNKIRAACSLLQRGMTQHLQIKIHKYDMLSNETKNVRFDLKSPLLNL